MKFGHVIFETSKQTDRQTDTLIAIRRTPPGAEGIKTEAAAYIVQLANLVSHTRWKSKPRFTTMKKFGYVDKVVFLSVKVGILTTTRAVICSQTFAQHKTPVSLYSVYTIQPVVKTVV